MNMNMNKPRNYYILKLEMSNECTFEHDYVT